MRILHTSDWHIGHNFYGRQRYAEFQAFFDWLLQILIEQKIDILLVAGDIFDNTLPSNLAQKLYYDFLAKSARICRHLVIISGNHDSPSLIDAPSHLLQTLHSIHIKTNICLANSELANENSLFEDALLILKDGQGQAELLVCAVPYLRLADLRQVSLQNNSLESSIEKDKRAMQSLATYYQQLSAFARQKQRELQVPLVAMGHLFLAEGQLDESVRELQIGNLNAVFAENFDNLFDFVALGHLHRCQTLGQNLHYAGSVLPLSFNETKYAKSVSIIEFQIDANKYLPKIETIEVPLFQKIQTIQGADLDDILAQIRQLKEQVKQDEQTIWLEIICAKTSSAMQARIEEAVANSQLVVLKISSEARLNLDFGKIAETGNLHDFSEEFIFSKFLESLDESAEAKSELMATYKEALLLLKESELVKD